MWHFTTLDKKLGYGDGRLIIAGEKLTVPGPIVLCKSGLHASKRLLDALKYAPGAYLWEVELSGEVIHGDDKSVATERTALWGFDASEVLRKFSRMVALQAVEKHWDESKLGAFPDVTLRWLKTGDETLRAAARSAAAGAAAAAQAAEAAEGAAWAAAAAEAAEAAAWAAARSAAARSAEAAAAAAAEAAAWAAAAAAAEAEAAARLAARSAEAAAAEAAAWAAAGAAQETLLLELVTAARNEI